MRRLALPVLILLALAPAAPADPIADFEGIWLGEIVVPNARTAFGLAFTRAGAGLAVRLYLPEMFLPGVDFGPAVIRDGAFVLEPLNLVLRRQGDALAGSFAIAKLPVELHRARAWPPVPPAPGYPPAPAPVWSLALGAPA